MSQAANVSVLRRVMRLINERRLDEAFEFYASDYIYHGPGGQELRGRDGIKGLWDIFLSAFPDLTASVEDAIAEDDKVAARWSVSGTHTGELLGIPPSNRSICLPIIEVFRLENGILVEAWDQYDRQHLMEQIGAAAA